jgi:hypothetical protein
MKNYYFNPANRDLIIFDTDAQDVQIVERIEKVPFPSTAATAIRRWGPKLRRTPLYGIAVGWLP